MIFNKPISTFSFDDFDTILENQTLTDQPAQTDSKFLQIGIYSGQNEDASNLTIFQVPHETLKY